MNNYFKKVFCERETYVLTIVFIPIITLLACLDYKNMVADYIISMDWKLCLIIGVGVILFGLAVFFGNHFHDLFKKIATVNILDRALSLCIISEITYLGFLLLINQAYTYKCIIISIAIAVCIILMIFRMVRFSKQKKSLPQKESKVYDLKELIDIDSISKLSFPMLISEKDVDYDLFDRQEIIFQLETALEISCASEYPFVIGLSGEWGSGKTTILNMLKSSFQEKEDILVIDNFDPWKYASSKAMLVGMYYTILQNTGVRYSEGQINELVNSVCDLVAETGNSIAKAGKITKIVLSQAGNEDSIDALKAKIDEYLEHKNITIVFIIDNLDRATAENVRFLFKLVGAVFDFKRVKYVLSYDKVRLSEIFRDSLQIDPRYMEKIINQELVVPKISENKREFVYRTCINNLLLSYGVDLNGLSDYEYIIDFIINNVQDIRMFKRLLNSAFFLAFGKDNLFKPDLLTLEIVRFIDIDIYESIYNKKEYFIDVDTDYDINIYKVYFNTKEFNKKCKSFYDNIFENKKHIMQLLTNIFPYVKRYAENHDAKLEGYSNSGDYKKTQLLSRINSVKYFDLYFSYSLNAFSNLSVEFNNSLNTILSLPEDKISDEFTKYINSIPLGNQNEWTLKLFLSKEDINNPAAFHILNSLCYNIETISDERGFLTPSPRERVFGVMTYLFKKIDTEKQESFVNNNLNSINKLFVITNMIYWLEENKDDETKKRLNNYAKNTCDNILNNSINIYEDSYYSSGNIWSIYHTLNFSKTPNAENLVKEYISEILSPEIVYRVLEDTVISSLGKSYGYYISKKSYDMLFDEETNIQGLLDSNPPKNESEKLIYDLYQDYVDYSGDTQPEHERYFDYPFKFNL